jgi:hypothetical protein
MNGARFTKVMNYGTNDEMFTLGAVDIRIECSQNSSKCVRTIGAKYPKPGRNGVGSRFIGAA